MAPTLPPSNELVAVPDEPHEWHRVPGPDELALAHPSPSLIEVVTDALLV